MRKWLLRCLRRLVLAVASDECHFCYDKSDGICMLRETIVSVPVCREHMFLLDCGLPILQRAATWKFVGYCYTREHHKNFKEKLS